MSFSFELLVAYAMATRFVPRTAYFSRCGRHVMVCGWYTGPRGILYVLSRKLALSHRIAPPLSVRLSFALSNGGSGFVHVFLRYSYTAIKHVDHKAKCRKRGLEPA